jgi:hypothetical protein
LRQEGQFETLLEAIVDAGLQETLSKRKKKNDLLIIMFTVRKHLGIGINLKGKLLGFELIKNPF